ncbi:MAG: hypothetical protein IJL92_04385 [Thermoguttaceae bacterium]|nr:hypothetical protein [Thermoguttaceae bacterium]
MKFSVSIFARTAAILLAAVALFTPTSLRAADDAASLYDAFANPPETARPGVYWFFLDGNLSKEGMRADLDAIKNAGMGRAIMMEADQGGPRGNVSYLSPEWLDCWRDASAHAEELGIDLTSNVGPGWCGAGGPWIKPEHSMPHLRASETRVEGGETVEITLPVPTPRDPYFGQGSLGPCRDDWLNFYRDVAVVAFPTPKSDLKLTDWEEKALFYRPPYSSTPGVKPYLAPITDTEEAEKYRDAIVPVDSIVDLSDKMTSDGVLRWDAPEGSWTILRLGRRLTGQTTRPAPSAGLGLESDKFERAGIEEHFRSFDDKLLDVAKFSTLHHDSWEMSSQNWSEHFRELFTASRGYDPIPWSPAIFGFVVGSVEETERFLWDLRKVGQELVFENNVLRMKELAAKRGLKFSTEVYDLNPAGDLYLFSAADVPMCEFWSDGYGFDSRFSVFEAVSSAHTCGQPIVASESFTTFRDQWRQYPGRAKRQGDWAFCAGVNRFLFHRMCSQPNDDAPGLSLGPHGMHFDRTQTWFPLLSGKHGYIEYITRVQSVLQRGLPTADVLLLDQETAPSVYVAPEGGFQDSPYKDKKGWNFDGCCPQVLIERAIVKDGKVRFPGGAEYSLVVLPQTNETTVALAEKLLEMKNAGVPIIGAKPRRTPGLANHEEEDARLAELVDAIWSGENAPIVPEYKKRYHENEKFAALLDAQWIWGGEWVKAPVGAVETFSKTISVPDVVKSAYIFAAADNDSEIFVNGEKVGGGSNFHDPETIDVASKLRKGDNEISIRVTNTGDAPNPSGLIATIMIDGQATRSDASWTTKDADGRPIETSVLGKFDMAPWNLRYDRSFDRDSTYPDWRVVEARLKELGIAPDFDAVAYRTGDERREASPNLVRWLHKVDGDADVYFVANVTDEPIMARCWFRAAAGKSAQLWDPMTGLRYALDTKGKDDASYALSFAPSQSWFVVFSHDERETNALPTASALFRPATTSFTLDLSNDWVATFDQNAAANRDFAKGREKTVRFDSLRDWSKSDDEYLRYYSGLAVYRKKFDVPKDRVDAAKSALVFDDVDVMAKVELNGQELATLWTKPWRVEIPQGLLKPTGNELTVTVANLWCNRLIGDASLPEQERFTRSSNPMWGPGDEQLQPSGLIGGARLTFGRDD